MELSPSCTKPSIHIHITDNNWERYKKQIKCLNSYVSMMTCIRIWSRCESTAVFVRFVAYRTYSNWFSLVCIGSYQFLLVLMASVLRRRVAVLIPLYRRIASHWSVLSSYCIVLHRASSRSIRIDSPKLSHRIVALIETNTNARFPIKKSPQFACDYYFSYSYWFALFATVWLGL